MKHVYSPDQDYFIECIRNALSHTGDGSFEMMIRFTRYDDRQLRWVTVKGTVFFNEDHVAQKLVGTMMDVTEEKNQQLALKESEERFRAMANEAPLFVWETDEKLQTTYLNKAGLEYFRLEEPVNMSELSWKKFIHPDDRDNVMNTMKNAAMFHQSYTLEMRLRNGPEGEYHWFLDKGAPRYQNDQFVGFIGTSLDINERKETEKALEEKVKARTREIAGQNILLQKQNDLVKKIFDSSVDAMGVYDTELRIITLNQTLLKILGGKEKNVIGKKLLDVLPQMEGTKGHKDLLSAINGKTIHNKVYYSEISNRYYENFLMPLKDGNDKVYAVLVMAHDNTELITAAEKLKEAQQIAQIGHWDWDVLTNTLTWSDNMYNIYGIDQKDGVDYERFLSLVHPDDRPNMQTNIESALQTRTFKDLFHRIVTPAGAEKVMHARGEVIVDKNGKIKRMVGTGQDVTQQKKIEQQLIETSKKIEQHNQFIEQLINSSLDLITVIDKDLRFITMNKKAQTLYKEYYKEDIIGKKVTDVNPPVKGTESYNNLLQALAGEIVIKDNVKSAFSDRYYEHNYIPLTNEHNEVYAVMLISHDITENIRQMEELKKLSESDEQKNNFIAMASHELKTPITSIKGYVQLLLNALEKEKENKKPVPPLLVRSSLISVDKQIKRLTRLISELLDISKIETGTLELKKETFSLNELAIETVEDILYTNTKHHINLYHDFQSHVYGDKDRIGQVMINFLTNAIKYSPDNDKIDVTIHKKAKEEVCFSVRDYGIGIEKEEQKKIFERFYRSKGKAEQTYPGFGIGLFIAYEFIQKHGGQVWVESEKGKGSTFTFTLPILKEQ
jgi:PAS domain S-box-containing protein